MATFVHIADERKLNLIQKNGLKLNRRHNGEKGLYCFPVLKDFSLSHQWARELRRTGIKNYICIQFTIGDDEIVEIGKYNEDKILMTANEAINTVMNHSYPLGLEVIILKKVLPKQISRIYPSPKLTGWRYYPEAKGRKPFCNCKYCNRGQIKAQRLIIE